MRDGWYVVLRTEDRKCISWSSTEPDAATLPEGLEVKPVLCQPNDDYRWDPETETVINRWAAKPVAVIRTFDPDTPAIDQTEFEIGEPIGIEVTLDGMDDGAVTVSILKRDPMVGNAVETAARIKLEVSGGVASRELTGFADSGAYGVDQRISDSVRVTPYWIDVVE
jgi:hypothetical protein